jgi:hypothetical protein
MPLRYNQSAQTAISWTIIGMLLPMYTNIGFKIFNWLFSALGPKLTASFFRKILAPQPSSKITIFSPPHHKALGVLGVLVTWW